MFRIPSDSHETEIRKLINSVYELTSIISSPRNKEVIELHLIKIPIILINTEDFIDYSKQVYNARKKYPNTSSSFHIIIPFRHQSGIDGTFSVAILVHHLFFARPLCPLNRCRSRHCIR